MIIITTNEAPLTVTVDGVEQTILTHNYTDVSGQAQVCKYIVAGGKNHPVQFKNDFDASTLPPA